MERYIILLILLAGAVSAGNIIDSIHLQGQTYYPSGVKLNATFQAEFNISVNNDCTDPFYSVKDNVKSDLNGNWNYYLNYTGGTNAQIYIRYKLNNTHFRYNEVGCIQYTPSFYASRIDEKNNYTAYQFNSSILLINNSNFFDILDNTTIIRKYNSSWITQIIGSITSLYNFGNLTSDILSLNTSAWNRSGINIIPAHYGDSLLIDHNPSSGSSNYAISVTSEPTGTTEDMGAYYTSLIGDIANIGIKGSRNIIRMSGLNSQGYGSHNTINLLGNVATGYGSYNQITSMNDGQEQLGYGNFVIMKTTETQDTSTAYYYEPDCSSTGGTQNAFYAHELWEQPKFNNFYAFRADGYPENVSGDAYGLYIEDFNNYLEKNLYIGGNVGIGTTTPTSKLHVMGNVNISGNITSNSSVSNKYVTSYNAPKYIGRIINSTYLNSCGWVYAVGKYVYATGYFSDAFVVIDASNTANMTIVGAIINKTYLNGAESIAVVGNFAFITATDGDYLTSVDISNPSNPQIAGHLHSANLNGAEAIEIVGNVAYTANYYGKGVSSVDISNPYNMTFLDTVTDNDLANPIYLTIDKDILFISARQEDCIASINISNPSDMRMMDIYCDSATLNYATGLEVEGKYLYVAATNNNAISIFDVSDPTNIIFISSITDATLLTRPFALAVSGKYVYVAAKDANMLTVLNVGDPEHPYIEGSFHDNALINGLDDVFIQGKTIFISLNNGNGVAALELPTLESTSAHIGTMFVNRLNIQKELILGGSQYIGGGLSVYEGFSSYGSSSIFSDSNTTALKLIQKGEGYGFQYNDGVNDVINITKEGAIVMTENLTVDSDTLFVDTINNNVGIGTDTPTSKLTIIGNINISGDIYLADSGFLITHEDDTCYIHYGAGRGIMMNKTDGNILLGNFNKSTT